MPRNIFHDVPPQYMKSFSSTSRVNAVRVTSTLGFYCSVDSDSNVTRGDYTAVTARDCHYTSTGACFRTGHESRGHHPEAERIDDEKRDRLLLVDPSSGSDSTTSRRRRRHGLPRQGNAEKDDVERLLQQLFPFSYESQI